jgi:hypothetical protein
MNVIKKWPQKPIFTILFFSIALNSALNAQDLKVSAELDAKQIKIGKQAHILLKATTNSGIQVMFPEFKDTITDKVELVEVGKIDTSQAGDLYTYQRVLTITAFDSGYFPIPPFKFKIKNDSTKDFETDALLIAVQTVPVDTTLAIKAIKGPINPTWSIFEILNEILLGWLIILLVVGIIYMLKKRKKVEVIKANPVIQKPAHEIALEALNELRTQKLWQQGRVKEYHIAISDIVRTYIENRYTVNAMEMTSDEIIKSLRLIITDVTLKSKLTSLLILSDMVKFAKEQPLPNENELSWEHANEFVKQTAIFSQKEEDSQ